MYEWFISENERGERLYLTIDSFRDVEYVHFRKYFQDFEGEYLPTKEGISFPLSIVATLRLFLALSEIVSEAEKDLLSDSLKEILNDAKAYRRSTEVSE